MQSAIGPNDSSSAALPLLDIWIQAPVVVDDGSGAKVSILVAPVSMSWVINAITTEAQAQAPVQVASGTTNLTTDTIPIPGLPLFRQHGGHYAATTAPSSWAMPGSPPPPLPFGRYQIVWTYTLYAWMRFDSYYGEPLHSTETQTFTMTREFDLVQGGAPIGVTTGAYCLPSDLRDEGVQVNDASDLRLLRAILLASKFIERTTGRFFEPRFLRQTVDGTGGRAVQFGDPLIAFRELSLGNPVQSVIGLGAVRLFNRHITERLVNPDDRDDPKVEFVHYRDIFGRQRSASIDSPLFGVPFRDLFFPSGVQNVNVGGLWGYTDWDGSAQGETPTMLRHATKLLVMREFRQLMDDMRDDRKRHRLTTERTRDQSYTLDKLTEGPYTGDREIDDILLSYRRPMLIGGA